MFDSEFFGKANALRRGDRHLRGGVDAQVWKHSARDLGETDILDDYGVHSGVVECLKFGDGIGQFLRED